MGRPAASPGGTSVSNFDNTTTSPLPYANSPRSSTNMMNTPSPQQQSQQQKQQQQQQQQQKLMQLPQHQQQQLLAQQQFRQSAMQGLGQVRFYANILYAILWLRNCCHIIHFIKDSMRVSKYLFSRLSPWPVI